MFERVVEDIQKYPPGNTELDIKPDLGEINLTADNFKLEVLINDRWIGYDFSLNKALTGGVPQGSALDTDLYPLDYDTETSRKTFNEVRRFVAALLKNKLYYGVIDRKAVFARPKNNREYLVTLIPKRRFLVNVEREVWPVDRVIDNPELTRLNYKS